MLVDMVATLLVKVFIDNVLTPLNGIETLSIMQFILAYREGLTALLSGETVRVLLGLAPWSIIGTGMAAWLALLLVALVVKLILTIVGIVTGRAG